LIENHGLFTVSTTAMTAFRQHQQQATELVSKWICKKVTKYLFLLNTLMANFLYSCIVEKCCT